MSAMVLPLSRLVLPIIGKRSLHTTKCASLFYEFPNKDGYLQKTEEEKEFEKLSFFEKLKMESALWKEGVKETYKEWKEDMIKGPQVYHGENEVDTFWKFTGDKSELDRWVITTDKDNNLGFSTAQLDFTTNSKGLFHGFLDTRIPPDGKMKRTGYCNLKMVPNLSPFKNRRPYEWEPYTHIVFRIRGDGRVYAVNLHLQRYSDLTQYDTYHYFIWTRGGPYWQHVRIPFSKFYFAYKGRIQNKNVSLPKHEVGSVSFTLADKITGPFRLEIDYLGVEYDASHEEEFAYEQYMFDQKFL